MCLTLITGVNKGDSTVFIGTYAMTRLRECRLWSDLVNTTSKSLNYCIEDKILAQVSEFLKVCNARLR